MVTLDQAGRARGWTRLIGSPPDLAPFVEFLWLQPGVHPDRSRCRAWRIVPDTSPHLVVKRMRDCETSSSTGSTTATFVGARSHHVDSDLPLREWTVGVRFRPGVLPSLTGLPASDFRDRGVPLAHACGAAGVRLERRLGAAPDATAALVRVIETLSHSLRSAEVPDSRLGALCDTTGPPGRAAGTQRPTVRQLAARIGMAERTLRQRCADQIGLSPGLAVRVNRLHRAIRLALDSHADRSWARIAAAAGYFDQSHLNRDFRLLLGETPPTFLARGR